MPTELCRPLVVSFWALLEGRDPGELPAGRGGAGEQDLGGAQPHWGVQEQGLPGGA